MQRTSETTKIRKKGSDGLQDWSYKGVDAVTNKRVKGKIRARSEADALEAANTEGVIALSVTRFSSVQKWLTTDNKKTAKRKHVNAFIRNYSTASSSNMRAENALKIATEGISSKPLKNVVQDITDRYADGVALHEAFGAHTKMFGEDTAAVLEAGSVSGQTAASLSALADSKERSGRIRGKIVSALVYPAILLTFAMIALLVVITFVIPKIETALQDLDAELPLLTRILVGIADLFTGSINLFPREAETTFGTVINATSNAASNAAETSVAAETLEYGLRIPNILFVLGLLVVAPMMLYSWLNTPTGKLVKSWLALNTPIIGPVVRRLNTAIICELCGVMLTSGVPQTRTMELVASGVRNHILASNLRKVPERLLKGMDLHAALALSTPPFDPIIPALAQQSASGLKDPGEPWRRYGGAVAEEADRRAALLQTAMEPVMIVMMGLLIGVIAAAVYLPLLSTYQALENI